MQVAGIVNSGAFWAESSDLLWNVVNGFISLVKVERAKPFFLSDLTIQSNRMKYITKLAHYKI